MTFTNAKLTTTLILAGALLGSGIGIARADVGALPARDQAPISREPQARIEGPKGALTITGGVLAGRFADGVYDVRLAADRARGSGPRGLIDVTLASTGGGYEVTGIWNGGRVHFVVGERSIRGRATRAFPNGEYGICHYDMGKMNDGRGYAGTSLCMGGYRAGHLEIHPRLPADLTAAQHVVLLVAYLTASSAPARI